jgi:hypothetical protein
MSLPAFPSQEVSSVLESLPDINLSNSYLKASVRKSKLTHGIFSLHIIASDRMAIMFGNSLTAETNGDEKKHSPNTKSPDTYIHASPKFCPVSP